MMLSHKAFVALNHSINNNFTYTKKCCSSCLHLEKLIEKNYSFTIKKENKNTSNPYRNLIFSYNFIHFETKDSSFDVTKSYFCPSCFSILYENIYNSSEETIFSYSFSPFFKMFGYEKEHLHLAISNYFFPAFFLPMLENKINYVYSIDFVNFNIPFTSETLLESLKEFSKFDNFYNLFLDLEDIPLAEDFSKYNKTIVRFSINEKDLLFNRNPENVKDFSSIGNFSFQISKNKVISVEFYDFLWSEWVHISNSDGLKKLISNNSIFFTKENLEKNNPSLSLEALAKKMIKHFYNNEK